MEKKYTLLRIIGTISKILGIIVAVFTILGTIGSCASGFIGSALIGSYLDQLDLGIGQGQYLQIVLGVILSIMTLIYGGTVAIGLYAVGQGVHLLIDIEENTRLTVTMLQGQYSGQIVD